MSKDRTEYLRLHKAKLRAIEKEFGNRYRTDEAIPGETYTEFVSRVRVEDMKTRYSAWEQIPGESKQEFKKRLTAKNISDKKTISIPAWQRAPNETDKEFKRRLTAKKIQL